MTTSRSERDEAQRRIAVVVMAKEPRPGAVKTRLAQGLGEVAAAEVYAAMLNDRCEQLERLDGIQPALALYGAGGAVSYSRPGFERVPQPQGGLGAGLSAAAEHYLAQGKAVVLVDSDTPSLPLKYLERAVELLRLGADEGGRDLVIGPAEDGGYYLIGLRRPCPALFEDIPWSTSEVVPITLERARGLALDVEVLPSWWDVDTPADLERLETSLLAGWWPRHTAEWLRDRKLKRMPRGRAAGGEAELWRAAWQRLGSRHVYATRWMQIREDRVLMPSGEPSHYGVVDCGQCVGVLPFVDEDNVLLVRQFRYVADRLTWEMPTGGVEQGEDPALAAARELAEEAQVRAGELRPLGAYHTSKSVMDETAHLYVARHLEPLAAVHGDDTEFLRAEPMPFRQLLQMVLDGEVVDSMTIIAVLRVALERA